VKYSEVFVASLTAHNPVLNHYGTHSVSILDSNSHYLSCFIFGKRRVINSRHIKEIGLHNLDSYFIISKNCQPKKILKKVINKCKCDE
jgi:hypothetical protein